MVREALRESTWIRDLAHGEVQNLMNEFIAMHKKILTTAVVINENVQDSIRWNFEESGTYSTRSAYTTQFFHGRKCSEFDQVIWKTWDPGKIKMFSWLLLQNHLWCNDRLQRRGWTNNYLCQLCVRNLETSQHLFWTYPLAREV